LVGNNMNTIKEVKKKVFSKFDMKDISATKFILGIKINRDQAARKLWLNQKNYCETILERFNM
jgi:hypothetical protein